MARPKKETEATAAFGPSPYPFAAEIDRQREEAEKQRRLEALRARQSTHPQHSTGRPGRPDLLALPAGAVESLAKKGLEACWIRKDQTGEYLEKGYKIARHEDIGGTLRQDYQDDPASSPTGAVERRELVLVIGPKSWREDRMKVEQHLAASQMEEDPFDSLKRQVKAGHFGKGARRPRALEFSDEEDDEG